jgi:hypothetical protein
MKNNFYVLNKIVGGKIESTVQDKEGEGFFGLQISLPDKSKKVIWFLSDDEGNAPGSFEIQNV